MGKRTALINQLRAILLERGIVIAQRQRDLERGFDAMLCEEGALTVSQRLRTLIEGMREEWRALDQRIATLDDEFAVHAKTDEATRRLATIPGIGMLSATALAAVIGEGQTFARGRDLAAWLGLVPQQITTGGKPRLVGITKRGNCYLRKLLIHGARAVLPTLSKSERDSARKMVACTSGTGPHERRCRDIGQQARADRLGCAAA